MDKFLIELLLENNSVILPEFGAIVIANEKTREVMFNEYLKFNDGKLISLIVAKSSMDEQEASNMVAKYIRDIQIQLDKGESYDIFGLGSFIKDKDGSALFNGTMNPSPKKEVEEFMGPSPTPPQDVEEVKVEQAPIENILEQPITEKTAEEIPELDLSSAAQDETSTREQEVEVPPIKAAKTSTKKEEKSKAVQPKKEKKKRGVLFWTLTVLLALLAGGSIFIGLKYEEVKSYMGWNKFDTIESVAQLDETTEEDLQAENDASESETNELANDDEPTSEDASIESEPIEAIEETKEEEEEAVVDLNQAESVNLEGKQFHLIAGSFSERSNADNLVAKLKSSGLPAHVLGDVNGLYMVSAKSFSARSEAMNEMRTIQNDAPGAWLFKYAK